MTEDRRVECAEHGLVGPAFVCSHLYTQLQQKRYSPVGFFQADFDPAQQDWDDLNGWCGACDRVLQRVGEWSDESEGFAAIKMVCSGCFERIREIQAKLKEDTLPRV